jgi:nitrate/nitrite transport system permease protein
VTTVTEALPEAASAVTAAPPPPAPKWVARLGAAAQSAGLAVIGALCLGVLWQLVSLRSADVPSPVEALTELQALVSRPFYDLGPNDKGIGLQLALSLRRVFSGFALAALVGIPVGFVIGSSRRCWQAINPMVQLLRPVSPLAWFPIWLVVFKNGAQAAVFVIFITALWPTLLNTAVGAQGVPADQRNVAKVFRFGRLAYLRHIVVPHSLPSIVTGLRLSMGLAWVVIVAVEMLSAVPGIGNFVWVAYNSADLPGVSAAILIIGVVGIGLDLAFLRLQRLVAIEEVHA